MSVVHLRTLRLLLAGVAFLACAHGGEALKPGWSEVLTRASKGNPAETVQYILYVPAMKPGQRYPLVVHLHGNGGGPKEIKGDSPILRTLSDAAWQEKNPCFILAPACPQKPKLPMWANTPWDKGAYSIKNVPISYPMQVVMDIIDDLVAQQPVDADRLYIAGGSMGGYGTWDALCRFPDKFAAAIPLSGSGDVSCAAAIKHIPIHAFHIAEDGIVPAHASRAMVDALKAVGGNIQYTEFPGGGHLWDQVWDPNNAQFWQPDLFPWLFAQKRAGAGAKPGAKPAKAGAK